MREERRNAELQDTVSIGALSQHWGVHRHTIRRMIRDGRLTDRTVGSLIRQAPPKKNNGDHTGRDQ